MNDDSDRLDPVIFDDGKPELAIKVKDRIKMRLQDLRDSVETLIGDFVHGDPPKKRETDK